MLEHGFGVALAVEVAEHRGAEIAAGPVVAGQVEIAAEGAAIGAGAGQHVVLVGGIADAFDDVALLGQAGLLADLVVAVQVVVAGGDDHALGVLPGALADAVAGIDGAALRGGVGAQIGVPGLAGTGAGGGRQRLAVGIRAGEAAEIAALAGTFAGYEEGHVGLLRL